VGILLDPYLYRCLIVEHLHRAEGLDVSWHRGLPPGDLRPEHFRSVDVLLTREDGEADCLKGPAGTVLRCVPEIPTVIIVSRSSASTVRALLDAGARGVLDERCAQADVASALAAAGTGGLYMCPAIGALVVGDSLLRQTSSSGQDRYQCLTAREREILMLLRFRVRRREIAERLGISTRTYDVHRRRIIEKLGVRSVEELDENGRKER